MPAFALDLSHDGIRLLAREGDGWVAIDTVRLDDPDLSSRMEAMRAMAEAREGPDFKTALIIPESEILYTTVDVPAGRTRLRDGDVASALDGLTPCPVDEMAFDWRRDGDKIKVAALDINTLDEAEDFAVRYGLNPVGFTARPRPDQFPDAPDFGPTQVVEPRLAPEATPAPTPDPIAEPEVAAEVDPEETPVFESQRTGTSDVEAEVEGPAAPPPAAPRKAPSQTLANSPFAALFSERKGPGLTALAVLAIAAALIWTAYALVSPRDEPVVTVLPPVADTPSTGGDPQIEGTAALPTEAARLPVDETPDPAPAAIPGERPPSEMFARRDVALFVPDPAAWGEDRALPPPVDYAELSAAEVWQTPPPPGRVPVPSQIETLYLASIDPAVRVDDAYALSPVSLDPGIVQRPRSLPAPGQAFDLDETGRVRATEDGAETPDGVTITLGQPDLVPPERPETAAPDTSAAIAEALAGPRPRGRPEGLIERNERARLGGRSRVELGAIRPAERPESAQAEAMAALVTTAPSAQAIGASPQPRGRPDNFDATVAALRSREEDRPQRTVAAPAPAQPQIPSSASVARQATIANALNLRRINLIGVYGSDANRRALVRLPSGRYIKVKVGDRVDGGQVAAIDDDELRYVKGGRNMTLKVPSG